MMRLAVLASLATCALAMNATQLEEMGYTMTKDHFLPGEFMVAEDGVSSPPSHVPTTAHTPGWPQASNHTGLGYGPSNCPQGDIDCERSSGAGSYCKYWQSPGVCQGSNLPCTCNPHNKVPSIRCSRLCWEGY